MTDVDSSVDLDGVGDFLMSDTPTDDPAAGFAHDPVMRAEVVAVLADVPDGVVVDATLGGAGHALSLLGANDGISLIGLDQDQMALDAAGTRLAPHGDRVTLHHRRFDAITEVVRSLGVDHLSGCLFDLGVSSPQLDTADRGFSFRHSGPLDMRMDQRSATTADELVNTLDEGALASLLRRHGDEPHARRIARAIVAARPIVTTAELADVIREAVPAAVRRKGGHPARRSFQAIRIEVNQELEILDDAIRQAIELLAPEGRCAVLAYHSGEDRIVKHRFRDAAGERPPPRHDLPHPPGYVAEVRLLWRGARKPSAEEIARNPRAEAARFRAVEKLAA
ncbi:MAG: 16S rRNA (cytosine(1402)-N(4))-methyltransferase RsmH [Acidimicrobiales bacterium]